MNDPDRILESLENAAEKVDDLTPLVYARFFRVYPEARECFGVGLDDGDYGKGRMLNSIIDAVLDQARGILYPGLIYSWGCDHQAYKATVPMCAAMLEALRAELADLLGPDWTPDTDAAWRRQFEHILKPIAQSFADTQKTHRDRVDVLGGGA